MLKKKKYIIIPISVETAFDEIKHPFLLKTFNKLRVEGNFLNPIKVIYRNPSEKAMAPHSSTLAWKIPWVEERGRLQSMGSQRVRHD